MLSLACLLHTGSAQEKIVAGKNNTISNPAFSLAFPEEALQNGDHWYLTQDYDSTYCVTIEATRKRRTAFSMHFFVNPILSDSLRKLPNKAIADDFRRMELETMQVFGVQLEFYQLEDVRQAEDSLHERLFYTLAYRQVLPYNVIFGYLYLALPADSNNAFMLVGHYAEAIAKSDYSTSYQLHHFNLFREVLGSLLLRKPAQKPSP
jgi:hypothetical protein